MKYLRLETEWRGGAQNHTLLRANRLKNHAFINSHTFQYAPTNVHLGTIWNDRFSVRAGVCAVDKAPILNSTFLAQQSKRDECPKQYWNSFFTSYPKLFQGTKSTIFYVF